MNTIQTTAVNTTCLRVSVRLTLDSVDSALFVTNILEDKCITQVTACIQGYIRQGCKAIKFFYLINYMICTFINLINHTFAWAEKR